MEDSGGGNGDIVVRDIVRQGVEGRRAKRKEPSPYTTPSKRMMR